jgi:hypothetical protein
MGYAVKMESRQLYDTDLTDSEWCHLEQLVPAARRRPEIRDVTGTDEEGGAHAARA